MAKNKDIITIDTSVVDLVIEDGKSFLIDPRAEDMLITWDEFKNRVKEVDDLIKSRLSEQMDKLHIKKIEGEAINVIKRFYGERFQITDQEIALGLGVAKEVKTVKPDTKAIEEYEKDTGELPDGVSLRERTESVSFVKAREKGGKHGR